MTLQRILSSIQKKSQLNYSGKKKCFTQKVQIVIDFEAGEILSSDFCHGRMHDFRLFKESRAAVQPHILILADAGYQGIAKIHKNSRIPFKRKKNSPLSEEEKKVNGDLSKQRITVEYIFRKLKIFRIVRDKCRNRGKRFSIRFNLVADCYNIQQYHHDRTCTRDSCLRARSSSALICRRWFQRGLLIPPQPGCSSLIPVISSGARNLTPKGDEEIPRVARNDIQVQAARRFTSAASPCPACG